MGGAQNFLIILWSSWLTYLTRWWEKRLYSHAQDLVTSLLEYESSMFSLQFSPIRLESVSKLGWTCHHRVSITHQQRYIIFNILNDGLCRAGRHRFQSKTGKKRLSRNFFRVLIIYCTDIKHNGKGAKKYYLYLNVLEKISWFVPVTEQNRLEKL